MVLILDSKIVILGIRILLLPCSLNATKLSRLCHYVQIAYKVHVMYARERKETVGKAAEAAAAAEEGESDENYNSRIDAEKTNDFLLHADAATTRGGGGGSGGET